MTPNRPYLIRAIYEWIVDNQMTPYLLVTTNREDVDVPTQFIENDKIVLNIAPQAVTALDLTNDWITFQARFSGKNTHLIVPPDAVIAIYSKENGQGMMFPEDAVETADGERQAPAGKSNRGKGQPSLKVVK